MRDEKGFDLWADGYDRAVGLSYEEGSYPFAGYREVLNDIYKTVMEKPRAVILDIGFGTGTLTSKLYEKGCDVFGQDFSDRMIELAREKMPNARLYKGDFSLGLNEELKGVRYDFIIATYSLHHLDDERKVSFLNELRGLLAPGGRILIGDVAFSDREQLERCKKEAGEGWDDEEFYFVADELMKHFPSLAFKRISRCAGVLSID